MNDFNAFHSSVGFSSFIDSRFNARGRRPLTLQCGTTHAGVITPVEFSTLSTAYNPFQLEISNVVGPTPSISLGGIGDVIVVSDTVVRAIRPPPTVQVTITGDASFDISVTCMFGRAQVDVSLTAPTGYVFNGEFGEPTEERSGEFTWKASDFFYFLTLGGPFGDDELFLESGVWEDAEWRLVVFASLFDPGEPNIQIVYTATLSPHFVGDYTLALTDGVSTPSGIVGGPILPGASGTATITILDPFA